MDDSGLWLIGLGQGDLNQMSISALSAAKAAKYRFLEGYTALLPPNELEIWRRLWDPGNCECARL